MSTILFTEQTTAPDTPASDKVKIYAKADGFMYSKDDAGVETRMSNDVSSNSFSTISVPAGTNPVADSTGDTLNLTTSDAALTITGTAATDTVDFTLNTVPVAKGGTGQTTATAAFNALDPLTTKGDLIVNDGTNSIRLPVGSNGQVLSADSAQASGLLWIASASSADPLATMSLTDDFPTIGNTTGQVGQLGWVESSAGTAATTIRKSGISGHPGIITLRPGTVSTGRAAIALGGDGFNTAVLSDGTTEIVWVMRSAQVLLTFEMLAIGMGDTSNAVGDQLNGVYFQLLGSPVPDINWFIVTANAGTRTRVNTGIAYAANTWTKLKITVNAAGTSVQANINGVLLPRIFQPWLYLHLLK
jgi:hypothetical protein